MLETCLLQKYRGLGHGDLNAWVWFVFDAPRDMSQPTNPRRSLNLLIGISILAYELLRDAKMI